MGSRLNWEINNKRNIRISEFKQKEVLSFKTSENNICIQIPRLSV